MDIILFMEKRHETLPVTCSMSSKCPRRVTNHPANTTLPRTHPSQGTEGWYVRTATRQHVPGGCVRTSRNVLVEATYEGGDDGGGSELRCLLPVFSVWWCVW